MDDLKGSFIDGYHKQIPFYNYCLNMKDSFVLLIHYKWTNDMYNIQ